MTWRYQILDHGTHLALHEVYDDDDVFGGGRSLTAKPTEEGPDGISWTAEPITFVCDPEEGPAGIIRSLEMALADARKLPVLKVTT